VTVYYLGEIPTGRQAVNSKGMRSYTAEFRLKTTSRTEDAYDVGSHASLPIIGDTHPSDSGAWCESISVACTDGWTGWVVTCQWTSEREYATDPTADPAIVTLNTEQFQKPAVFDVDGYGICNSAGDPYDPPEMMDDSRRLFTVMKNMASVPSWVISSQDAINNDVFSLGGLSIGVGLAKVQSVAVSEPQSRNGVSFRTVTFQIQVQRDGWTLRPLDAGFRQLAWDGATRINIYTPDSTGDTYGGGERITAPVPLDGAGQAQANPTIASAVYGSHVVYQSMAFSTLPLT
jgi:hypothetical protein